MKSKDSFIKDKIKEFPTDKVKKGLIIAGKALVLVCAAVAITAQAYGKIEDFKSDPVDDDDNDLSNEEDKPSYYEVKLSNGSFESYYGHSIDDATDFELADFCRGGELTEDD